MLLTTMSKKCFDLTYYDTVVGKVIQNSLCEMIICIGGHTQTGGWKITQKRGLLDEWVEKSEMAMRRLKGRNQAGENSKRAGELGIKKM